MGESIDPSTPGHSGLVARSLGGAPGQSWEVRLGLPPAALCRLIGTAVAASREVALALFLHLH